MPSIGIYTYELDIILRENIIRVGSAGGLGDDVHRDIVISKVLVPILIMLNSLAYQVNIWFP